VHLIEPPIIQFSKVHHKTKNRHALAAGFTIDSEHGIGDHLSRNSS